MHHATKTAIEKDGFTVEIGPFDNEDVVAVIGNSNPKFEFDVYDGKTAKDDAKALRMVLNEYPNVQWEKDGTTWSLSVDGMEFDETAEEGELQELIDLLLDAAQEAGADLGKPEEEARVVVVPQRYKEEYKARGDATHCGDWIAKELKGQFRMAAIVDGAETSKEVFDIAAFVQFLTDNGVELSGKWYALKDNPHPSAIGRFRMNGRQKIEKRVAATGVMHLEGNTLVCPQADLEVYWKRHPEAYTEWEEARQPKKTDHKGKISA